MGSKIDDLTGRQFGNLYVEGYSHTDHGQPYYTCVCSCGTRKTVVCYALLSGRTQSCGCLQRKRSRETVLVCTGTQNGTNLSKLKETRPLSTSKSGIRGVSWNKPAKKWMANIGYKGKTYNLGVYSTTEEAEAAYLKAKAKILAGISPDRKNDETMVTDIVLLRLSISDKALLEQKASTSGITTSEYVQNLVIKDINLG